MANIEPHEALRRISVEITNEIDALAADPRRRILWVVSAKDSEQVLSAAKIKNQLNGFYGGNRNRIARTSFTADLHRQVALLVERSADAAAALGIRLDSQTWK